MLPGHEGEVRAAAFLGEGRLATGGEDRAVRIWDLETGKLLRTLPHPSSVYALSAGRDGKTLVSAAEAVRVWDAATGELLLVCDDVKDAVMAVALSPDGKRIASGDTGGRLAVFDARTGRQLLGAEAGGQVFGLAWSRDGRFLVSGGEDRVVRVHEAGRGGEVAAWPGHGTWVAGVACLEGGLAATGDGQGQLRLWRLPEGAEAGRAPPAREYPENESYLARRARQSYRAGRHAAALDELTRWDAVTRRKWASPDPACLGMLALTRAELGRAEEARQALAELRELMRHARCAADEEAAGLYRLVQRRIALPALGPEEEAVRSAVVRSHEAGWARHDLAAYLELSAADARYVAGRGEKPDAHDVVRDRGQQEAFLKVWLAGPPAAHEARTFRVEEVRLRGDEADVRLRNVVRFPAGYFAGASRHRMKRGPGGWKVVEGRSWPLGSRLHEEVEEYGEAAWRRLEEEAERHRAAGDDRGEAEALFRAYRYREAHAVWKRVSSRAGAVGRDWVDRATAALHAGDLADAARAAREARRLDPKVRLGQRLEAALGGP